MASVSRKQSPRGGEGLGVGWDGIELLHWSGVGKGGMGVDLDLSCHLFLSKRKTHKTLAQTDKQKRTSKQTGRSADLSYKVIMPVLSV